MTQRIVIFEGADKSGKTEIARALSTELAMPYFKYEREWDAFRSDPAFFRHAVRYGEDYFTSYLRQSGASVVKDRGHPSEWVYSRAFRRQTDDDAVWHADRALAELGAVIVLCRRKSYADVYDDLFPERINPRKLDEIDSLYEVFATQTRCRVIELWVDDEDLGRELTEIKSQL